MALELTDPIIEAKILKYKADHTFPASWLNYPPSALIDLTPTWANFLCLYCGNGIILSAANLVALKRDGSFTLVHNKCNNTITILKKE